MNVLTHALVLVAGIFSLSVSQAALDYSTPYAVSTFMAKNNSLIPDSMVIDRFGKIYVSDRSRHRIFRITPEGIIQVFAGSGVAGSADGQGASASFNEPTDLGTDSAGNLYVFDQQNYKIRKITPAGMVSTLAGSGSSGNADGQGTSASFTGPCTIAIDPEGNIYVAEISMKMMRKVTPSGMVSTLSFFQSYSSWGNPMAFDTQGNFFEINASEQRVIKEPLAGGERSIYSTAPGYVGAVCIDRQGNTYVISYSIGGGIIHRIAPDGTMTKLAGNTTGFGRDGVGEIANFNSPSSIACDPDGVLYVGELDGSIRKAVPTNQIIDFPALDARIYPEPPFQIPVTSTSGLPVMLSVVSGPATISGASVTLTGKGKVVVRAIQPGNFLCPAASPVDRSFSVSLETTLVRSSIAAGAGYYLFLKEDGTAWAAGSNGSGQFGNGTASVLNVSPLMVMEDVKAISTQYHTSIFLKNDGTAWTAGANEFGQIGNGSTINQSTAVQVLSGIESIEAGCFHNLFLKSDGSIWATGYNLNGEHGDKITSRRETPAQTFLGAVSMAGGLYHSLFLKTDGGLRSSGWNANGQLGIGGTTSPAVPANAMADVAAVSAGDTHSLILKRDGSAWAAGSNYSGQLGLGDDGSDSPRFVQVMTGVKAISAGSNYSVFLKDDGTAWATGDYPGEQGELRVPVQVMNHVAGISAGGGCLFLRTDGSFWAVDGKRPYRFDSISGKQQTINFPEIGGQELRDFALELGASASSYLPISYSIISGPAVISGSSVCFSGEGSVTVRARQLGNDEYSGAIPVDRTFSVVKSYDFEVLGTSGMVSPHNVSGFTAKGLDLKFSLNYHPVAGQVFTLVNNTGQSATTGRFNGIEEYDLVTATFGGTLYRLAASYKGGTGNDFTLTLLAHNGAPSPKGYLQSIGHLAPFAEGGEWRECHAPMLSADGRRIAGFATNIYNQTPEAFGWSSDSGIFGLGLLPGSYLARKSMGTEISANGSTIVGDGNQNGYSDLQAFRWKSPTNIKMLGDLAGGAAFSVPTKVSSNGDVIFGRSSSSNNTSGYDMFRWTESGGMVSLGDLPGGSYGGEVLAISKDGSVAVGWCGSSAGQGAFRWTSATGMVDLGAFPGNIYGRANGVSGDGQTVVGSFFKNDTQSEAFVWTATAGMKGIGDLSGGGFNSSANFVSTDGKSIFGTATSGLGEELFRWTSAGGMVSIGAPPGSKFGPISADGSTAVVAVYLDSGIELRIWKQGSGLLFLRNLLNGTSSLEMARWIFDTPTDISDDGLVLVGDGSYDGQPDSWIAVLPKVIDTPPVALPQAVTTEEDVAKNISLAGSDPQGASLTYVLIDNPKKGSLSGVPPNVTYKPKSNFNGSDSFTFRVIRVRLRPGCLILWGISGFACPVRRASGRDRMRLTRPSCGL